MLLSKAKAVFGKLAKFQIEKLTLELRSIFVSQFDSKNS
jgi:hypothetical protein